MKLRRKKKQKKSNGAPKWMTTYADMVTLILVFFILLFSMSQINLVKFNAIAESFRNRMIFDFYPSPIEDQYPTEQTKIQENGEKNNEFEQPVETPDDIAEKLKEQGEKDELDQVMEEVNQFLNKNELNDIISATRTERGVVLVLQEQLLFETGEANILASGEPFLKKVGTLLKHIPNQVKVEGHTDNRSISTFRYPSNWELSGARASSVIRFLISNTKGLKENRFTAVAYGDTKPVAPNNSKENWRKNRRVEIVILDPDYPG
ncbi:flagellar motor protein MotB [Halobacillus salinarum]|uniref:Flagellar motor protein MotB n=1 Tax=Halobacillus salinarum TaxID=2932257 RepID=A0ABY4EQ67_9BACI|nr:flagellar motor protein MotS [Halobacillus salinarum]UOQ46130.1 flagellar motor protein MotB [Halobacillus salinarum]